MLESLFLRVVEFLQFSKFRLGVLVDLVDGILLVTFFLLQKIVLLPNLVIEALNCFFKMLALVLELFFTQSTVFVSFVFGNGKILFKRLIFLLRFVLQ